MGSSGQLVGGQHSNIPGEMRQLSQWVCWRPEAREGSKPAKVPINPKTGGNADVTNTETWCSLTDAENHFVVNQGRITGIGFVFKQSGPFVGIDLDGCIEGNGELDEFAANVVSMLGTYTEYSPSGTGIHCICRGTLPEGNFRSDDIEVYESERFFTVTAASVREIETPNQVTDCTTDLVRLYSNHGSTTDEQELTNTNHSLTTGGGNELSDEEVLEKARRAANGNKFQQLWNGDTEAYPSQSEADLALCTFLAFWTGGDGQQIDRLFRKSNLMRQKWDEQRGNITYGNMTVSEALDVTEDFYGTSG